MATVLFPEMEESPVPSPSPPTPPPAAPSPSPPTPPGDRLEMGENRAVIDDSQKVKSAGGNGRRIHKRKLVPKMTVNEEGYMGNYHVLT